MADGFRFNFCLNTEEEEGSAAQAVSSSSAEVVHSRDTVATARIIPVLPFHRDSVQYLTPTLYPIPNSGTKLRYISGQQSCAVADTVPNGTELKSLLAMSDSQHSDLIPGVYEGGLKVWECAFDLVRYLLESDLDFLGKRVLELGCGSGLPGIYCLTRGAESVHFQDYNPEVIDCVTIPNVLLNTEPEHWNEIENRVRFYSGDWSQLWSILEPEAASHGYDVILTSETIYCLKSQRKLLCVLKRLCSCGSGRVEVYVAAKGLYFGVGGGVDSFCQLLEEDGMFVVRRCREVQDSVPRVILKLESTS